MQDSPPVETMPRFAVAEPMVAKETIDPFKHVSPPLGARFLFAGNNAEAFNPFKQFDFDPTNTSNSFDLLNAASNAARIGPGDNSHLAVERADRLRNSRNSALDKILDIHVKRGERVSEEKVAQGVEFLASCFDTSEGENRAKAKMEVLIDALSNYYTDHKGEVDADNAHIRALFTMFGEKPGIAGWQAFIAKMNMTDASFVEKAKTQNLSDGESALLASVGGLATQWQDLRTGSTPSSSPAPQDAGANIPNAESANEPSAIIDGQPLPTTVGGTIVGLRGKERSGDSRGQDRLFYKKLANGAEVYSVTDGAGEVGHEVAEKVSQRLAELLEGEDINSVSAEKLKQLAQQIHSEMQNFSGQKSGATLDAIVRLPSGKRFAMHVGEGTIFKLRTKEELGQKLLQGSLFEALTQPHGFGVDGKGDPIRTSNGIKTREMGVDAQITPDVVELQEGVTYLLTSDGFSDVLSGAPISSVEFMKRFKESPQKAAEYLVDVTSQYSQNTYGKDADDVAVMVVT